MEFLQSQDFINSSYYKLLKDSNNLDFRNIQGATRLKLVNGQATFTPEKFFAHPDAEVFFKVSSPTILRYYSELLSINSTLADLNINDNYFFIFSIQLRKCIVGEIFISQINRSLYQAFFLIIFSTKIFNYFFSCNKCTNGKYSLLDPYKAKICQSLVYKKNFFFQFPRLLQTLQAR